MNTKNAEGLVREMNDRGILAKQNMTYPEYTDELIKFQNFAAELVFGEECKRVRLGDVTYKMIEQAREKGVFDNLDFQRGIKTLKNLQKEINVTQAGMNSERRVAYTLNFVERKDFSSYKNVYVSDGNKETELDIVALTNNGFIVFEIKGTKSNVTISEDGRILQDNKICYHNESVGEKMERKRNLLRKAIMEQLPLEKEGMDLRIDSYLTFSTPKNVKINIADYYHKESYCFGGSVPKVIDGYKNDALYSDEEMELLRGIMNGMESNKKSFPVPIDVDESRQNFAKAIELLSSDVSEQGQYECEGANEAPVCIEEDYTLEQVAGGVALALLTGGITLPLTLIKRIRRR